MAIEKPRFRGDPAYLTQHVSEVASTTTLLASSATFTSPFIDALHFQTILLSLITDLDGTLFIDYSPDGANVNTTETVVVTGGTAVYETFNIEARFCRVRYANGSGGTQTTMRLQTILGNFTTLAEGATTEETQDEIRKAVIPATSVPGIAVAITSAAYAPLVTSGSTPATGRTRLILSHQSGGGTVYYMANNTFTAGAATAFRLNPGDKHVLDWGDQVTAFGRTDSGTATIIVLEEVAV